MLLNQLRRQRRDGATVVETAAVMIVFLMMLFGVVEYCRFFFWKQLMDNAAREGARYAVVHTYDANVETDTNAKITAKMGGMDGQMKNFTIQLYRGDSSGNRLTVYDPGATGNYAYGKDATGNYLTNNAGTKTYTSTDATGPYVLNGSTKVYLVLNANTMTVTGVNASTFATYVTAKKIQSVDPLTNAKFGEYVAVEISGEYSPITPALLRLGNTISLRAKSIMYSEAN